MIWLLFMILGSERGSIATAEFNTEAACYQARKQLDQAMDRTYHASFCAPKGAKP